MYRSEIYRSLEDFVHTRDESVQGNDFLTEAVLLVKRFLNSQLVCRELDDSHETASNGWGSQGTEYFQEITHVILTDLLR